MKHNVCSGSCQSISDDPKKCDTENCSKVGQDLKSCVCEDGSHKGLVEGCDDCGTNCREDCDSKCVGSCGALCKEKGTCDIMEV